ncbi:TPA: ABC transporter, partial [bacterium]|nr:ABC transporter [bacterium]
MIKIENLYFNFSNHFNLTIERLEIKEGEIFVIIGPNGAGKSTLLNIIALFEKPKSGKIEILGKELSKLNNHDKLELRRKMAFIFPIPYLLSDTVYNNIYLPLKLRNIRDDNQVDKILNFFKIKHINNDHISLSQGEKQRVILARAFITNPRLILLDEPFSNLDKQYKEPLISDLYKIIKENKTTVIFVTQNQQEALALADTIAVMKDGKILQQGNPEEIFTKPASKEIADFIGIETIVEGIIIKKQDNLCFIKVQDKILEAISEYNED